MSRREIENELFDAFEPLVRKAGVELLDMELLSEGKRTILRATIFRPEGVTLDDCVAAERIISPVLDQIDPIPGSYNLEISSPGLERTLRRDKEYEVFAGKPCQVNLYAPVNGKRVFRGVLAGLRPGDGGESEKVLISTDEGDMAFDRKNVSKVQLIYTDEDLD
ncbi:MAG: ribosome maturation factor RimP [Candidatus Fermentithermobacillus carboniphilus]|uniref:Ribosome maturation factor RimP n=1 Tax=Candidatus Fermentithermobacillus carboniphilus TaxID=3085328 RepID=A0AAT9LEQ5_9FIRM|nr:MAG: ribosome maturation factor RimP [Candidatus Fermentithermobacillus carboniphilus]